VVVKVEVKVVVELALAPAGPPCAPAGVVLVMLDLLVMVVFVSDRRPPVLSIPLAGVSVTVAADDRDAVELGGVP